MPLQKRVPKYGFTSKLAMVTAEIRSAEINKVEGDVVDMASLKAAGLINGSIERARIFLAGDVTRALTVKGIGVTKGAKQAIESAGGKIEE